MDVIENIAREEKSHAPLWLYLIGAMLLLAGVGGVAWGVHGYKDAKTKADQRAAVWDEFNRELKDDSQQRWGRVMEQFGTQKSQGQLEDLWKQGEENRRKIMEDTTQKLILLSSPDPLTVLAKRAGAGVFIGCLGLIMIRLLREPQRSRDLGGQLGME
jgi:hypothetical protein